MLVCPGKAGSNVLTGDREAGIGLEEAEGRGSSVEGGGELWRDNCVSELFFIPRCQESIYTYAGKSP